MYKIFMRLITNCLIVAALPVAANAAGTYYTGAAYQPTQYRYGQSGTYATSIGYNRAGNVAYQGRGVNGMQNASKSSQQKSQTTSSKNGFFANAGITHESAMWKFDMKTAGSILRYDDLEWNVFDLSGGYVFGLGKANMQVDAGFKYGIQWGESSMVDDDISNGGFDWVSVGNGYRSEHALSIGTSKDGSMLGFNVGVGLSDFFKLGKIKFTPSIGYRYFKHKLETKNNYGMEMATGACFKYEDGEIRCDPAIYGIYTDGSGVKSEQLLWRDSLDDYASAVFDVAGHTYYTEAIDYYDTFYVEQPGTSHSYEVVWSGPYIALDMLYEINQNNNVNGRLEFGFPGYSATGDQPYRPDLAHPKSVEDSAGMFSAFHLGLSAAWQTAITNSISLSLGVLYDYYTIDGADSKAYLNKELYDKLVAEGAGDSFAALYLNEKREECGGWVCKTGSEIESVYKSMGVRVGINAKF